MQSAVLERGSLEVVEHHLHLGHRFTSGLAHLIERGPGAVAIALKSRLYRRSSRLDDEQLLLDGIVQIAGEAGALFLADDLADPLVVLGPQRIDRGLAAQPHFDVARHHAVRVVPHHGGTAGWSPRSGEREVEQHTANRQHGPPGGRRQHQHEDGDPLPQQQQTGGDVRECEPEQTGAAPYRVVDARESGRTQPERHGDRAD